MLQVSAPMGLSPQQHLIQTVHFRNPRTTATEAALTLIASSSSSSSLTPSQFRASCNLETGTTWPGFGGSSKPEAEAAHNPETASWEDMVGGAQLW